MNEYQHYYKVYRSNGYGYLVYAFSGLQAIAKLEHLGHIKDKYYCVCLLPNS